MLTYKDVQQILGVTRQRIQRIARDYGWRSTRIGNVRIFEEDDILRYQSARFAFRALKTLGLIKGHERPVFFPDEEPPEWDGEVLDEDYMLQCPVCHERWSVCLPDGSRGICPKCGEWGVKT